MQIDFGGIGKEYAVDRVTQSIREASSCSVLVNFGGDLGVTRAPAERPAWKVGIESVGGRVGAADTLIDIRTGALATSGDARRYLLRDGVLDALIRLGRTPHGVPPEDQISRSASPHLF